MSSARKGEQPPGLPWRCHVVLPGLPAGANVAVCESGTNGVRMTSIDLGAFQAARRLVRALNETLGIDAVAEHAMLVGCLRGWRREKAGPGSMHEESQRSVSVERHARDGAVLH